MSNNIIENPVLRRNRLFEIIKIKSLFFGNFTLSSGKKSHYYFDLKRTTLDPEGSTIIARIFLDLHKGIEYDSVGGSTLGADPITSSISSVSYLQDDPKPGFIVRKASKGHGTQNLIEGGLSQTSRVVLVDDVITTGKSVFDAATAVLANGCQISGFFTVINRTGNNDDTIFFQGVPYPIISIFNEDELLS